MTDDGKYDDAGEFDGEFEDDFSDAEFDEASYADDADYAEFSGDEDGDTGDEFEADDWDEADAPAAVSKPVKRKSSGSNFNTIVIIGAVIVGGGVMAFNIMKESGKQQAATPTAFQSILNIGGIMDGTLFGDAGNKSEEQEPESTQSTGFLNDPSSSLSGTGMVPPQPVPLAPSDDVATINDPLTPMPSPDAPRGPDEAQPVLDDAPAEIAETAPEPADDVPPPAAQPSAEDILKQAMANREQRQQEPPVVESVPQEEAVAIVPEEQKTIQPIVESITPPSVPVATPPASLSSEDRKALEDSRQTVTALESRLEELLTRMDRIEQDLGTIRESGGSDSSSLEKTVADLRKDIAEIKSRPSVEQAQRPSPAPPKRTEPAPAPRRPAANTVEPTPAPPAKAAGNTSSAVRWELRAAQPGRAWVSRQGERDMQAVSVGDTLAGIGRISAIAYQNGRWSVVGAQGTIQQ